MFRLMILHRVFGTTIAERCCAWPSDCPVWTIRRGGWHSTGPGEQILEGLRIQRQRRVRQEIRDHTLTHMSCLSLLGAVNFISLKGVDTTTLYWWRPGGRGLGSSTERTPSIYATRERHVNSERGEMVNITHHFWRWTRKRSMTQDPHHSSIRFWYMDGPRRNVCAVSPHTLCQSFDAYTYTRTRRS